MANDVRTVHCTHCGARGKCPVERQRFRCPKCKGVNVLAAMAPDVHTARAGEGDTGGRTDGSAVSAPSRSTAPTAVDGTGIEKPDVSGIPIWLIGAIIGVLGAFAVSIAKPTLGLVGLMVIAGGLVTLVAGLFIAFRAAVWGERATTGDAQAAARRLRARVHQLLRLSSGCAVVCLGAVIAEWQGPSEGILRHLTAPAEKPAVVVASTPPAPAVPITFPGLGEPSSGALPNRAFAKVDDKVWGESDFLLINPTERAVGIHNTGSVASPRYQIVAKAQGSDVAAVKAHFWETKTPIYAGDPQLARRIFDEYGPKDFVLGDRATELAALFQPRPFVPARTTFLSYFDVLNKRRRVGHLLKDSPAEFVFCDLVPQRADRTADAKSGGSPFQTEIIRRDGRVQPGSEIRDLNDLALKESADFLDYCVYGLLARLQTLQAEATDEHGRARPNLYLDVCVHVQAGEFKAIKDMKDELKEMKSDFRGDLTGPSPVTPQRVTELLGVLAQQLSDRQARAERMASQSIMRQQAENDIREMREDIKKLRRLLDVEDNLASEIRLRLIRANVKQVDHSDQSQKILRNEVVGKKWGRPAGEEAIATGLADATHLLMTDLRKSDRTGQYVMSMRLVNVRDSAILWEEIGVREDREPDSSKVPVPPSEGAGPSVANDGPDIGGRWKDDSGFVVDVSESNGKVELSLVGGPVIERLQFTGSRKGNKVTTTQCTLVYAQDAQKRQWVVNARLEIVGPERLQFQFETINVDNRGHEKARGTKALVLAPK